MIINRTYQVDCYCEKDELMLNSFMQNTKSYLYKKNMQENNVEKDKNIC